MRLPFFLLASAVLTVAVHAADIPPNYATPDNLSNVIQRYLAAQQSQQEAMRGARMEVEIDAQLPSLEKKGKLKVLRMITKIGQITFQPIGQFIGDPVVKKEVIGKYLELEQDERQKGSIGITPANYKFRLKSRITGIRPIFSSSRPSAKRWDCSGRALAGRRYRHATQEVGQWSRAGRRG